jgi:hypothetical protein
LTFYTIRCTLAYTYYEGPIVIRFTKHAEEKFLILKRHGFIVSRQDIIAAVLHPDLIDHSRTPLKIAQCGFDKSRVLRVVYRDVDEAKIIITFYPGRRNQYEKK